MRPDARLQRVLGRVFRGWRKAAWAIAALGAVLLAHDGGPAAGGIDKVARAATQAADLQARAAAILEALPSSKGDFDGDGKADILWRNLATGAMELWRMNGQTVVQSGALPSATTDWRVQPYGDFRADGRADIYWRNATTGALSLWQMNGFTVQAVPPQPAVSDLMWAVRGVADFNGDGKVDVFWRHETLEGLVIWLTGGSSPSVTQPGLPWQLQGVGDFNGDGKADLLWRHAISAGVVAWLMDGATIASAAALPYPTLTLNVAGLGDFNGDGKTDILWRDELSGDLELWLVDGLAVTAMSPIDGPDLGWSVQRVLDFNGDGKADILWRNAISGNMVVWLMDGATKLSGASIGVRSDANWQVQGNFNWQFGALTAAPTASPASGSSFVGQTTVTLSAAAGATIRYTTNGIDPTATSPRYTGPFPVTDNVTVKAKAFREGWTPSPTLGATYSRQAATPLLNPSGGPQTNSVQVAVTAESETEVRYTVGFGTTRRIPRPPRPFTARRSWSTAARR